MLSSGVRRRRHSATPLRCISDLEPAASPFALLLAGGTRRRDQLPTLHGETMLDQAAQSRERRKLRE